MSQTQDYVLGHWNEVEGIVRRQWDKLTNEDLAQMHGRQEELVSALQRRYGYAKARAEQEIDDWLHSRS